MTIFSIHQIFFEKKVRGVGYAVRGKGAFGLLRAHGIEKSQRDGSLVVEISPPPPPLESRDLLKSACRFFGRKNRSGGQLSELLASFFRRALLFEP
jgi:hypothetical protein